jgi:hypothetical protein
LRCHNSLRFFSLVCFDFKIFFKSEKTRSQVIEERITCLACPASINLVAFFIICLGSFFHVRVSRKS